MAKTLIITGVILLLCVIEYGEAAATEYVKYKDPKVPVEDRVEDLLQRMTLAEKVGQMCQVDRSNYSLAPGPGFVRKYMIGSILSNPYDTGANPAMRMGLANTIQQESLSTRLGIPIIYSVDAVHGHSTFINATVFPHNVGLGVTRDPELIRRIGAITAEEVRTTGIAQAFAPCVAVCRDPRWGRCYESYSEDPSIVNMMTDIIDGLQGKVPQELQGRPFLASPNNVGGCAKHFVGDGGTEKGINEMNAVLDNRTLYDIHMPPFELAIKKGITSIMASFSSLNGVKMHANKPLLTDYLKNTLKFQGYVISDWLGIDRITTPERANYTYSIEASINAGIDMVMVPFQFVEFIDGLTDLVNRGFIPMARIDDAVRRILRVKFAMGLFENPMANPSPTFKLGSQEHREVAREAVRKSMVLLKNGKNENEKVIPLTKNPKKILVVGPHANNLGWQCGGFTLTWQGFNGTNVPSNARLRLPTDDTTGTTILKAIKDTVEITTKVEYVEEATPETVNMHRDASYAVVVVGEQPYAETKGDNPTLALPDQGVAAIKNVCGRGLKCIVILITGRPLVIEPYLDMMDALAVAWLPGTEGQGVADVLFGDFPFTGTLARTWMKNVAQLPMNVGDARYDPLFPFGFGIKT
ncbi:PREDICTED: uncharacterized protein LOC104803070 [Tarenaya hassleriana]|uniref:uncharacterized protein LOC104803070 n=1 Tax=Tarenaya hassleriana TaxID=28532 RepID=UPI00053C7371|nr:PREDICTED: uncharacterized protein LOC104803070 [Tarenaya hassleriana]